MPDVMEQPVESTESPSIGWDEQPYASDGDAETEVEGGEVTQETEAVAEDGDQSEGGEPTIESLAEEFGLDPNNPKHRKLLENRLADHKRIADSQTYIQQLKSKDLTAELDALFGDEEESPKSALTAPSPKTPPPGNEQPAQGQRAPLRFGDVGDGWESVTDGYVAENEAIEAINKAETPEAARRGYARYHAVKQAQQRRMLADELPRMAAPLINIMLEQFMEKHLAPHLPQLQQITADRQFESVKQSEISRVANDKKFGPLFREMVAVSGEPINADGVLVDNNAFNRIMLENPEVFAAFDRNPDRREGFRDKIRFGLKKFMEQKQANSPEKAKQIMKAGAVLQQKQDADKARRSLNAGKGSANPKAVNGSAGESRTRSAPVWD